MFLEILKGKSLLIVIIYLIFFYHKIEFYMLFTSYVTQYKYNTLYNKFSSSDTISL